MKTSIVGFKTLKCVFPIMVFGLFLSSSLWPPYKLYCKQSHTHALKSVFTLNCTLSFSLSLSLWDPLTIFFQILLFFVVKAFDQKSLVECFRHLICSSSLWAAKGCVRRLSKREREREREWRKRRSKSLEALYLVPISQLSKKEIFPRAALQKHQISMRLKCQRYK